MIASLSTLGHQGGYDSSSVYSRMNCHQSPQVEGHDVLTAGVQRTEGESSRTSTSSSSTPIGRN